MEHKLEAYLLICGVGVQEPYEGLLISVNKCDVEFNKKLLKNCVRVHYTSRVESETDPVDQQHINQILIKEVNLFMESLALMMIHPSQLIGYDTKLDGLKVELKLPPRSAPLGLYNFTAFWSLSPKEEIRKYTSVIHKEGWESLEKLLEEYHKNSAQMKSEIELALHWVAKASNEMFSLDRLVAYWIAFNSLYEDSNRSEQDAIKNYLQRNFEPYLAENFIKKHEKVLLRLPSIPVELGRGNKKRHINQELASLLSAKTRDHIAILKSMTLTIYGIRNNLFHGSYDPESEDVLKHIQIAEHLLSRLIKEIIAGRMLGYPLPYTKFVIQEMMNI